MLQIGFPDLHALLFTRSVLDPCYLCKLAGRILGKYGVQLLLTGGAALIGKLGQMLAAAGRRAVGLARRVGRGMGKAWRGARQRVRGWRRRKHGGVAYGELDPLGRPTGARAVVTRDMLGTGTPASRSIRPPGFEGRAAGHARGHLIGKQLGGSGTDPRNLVTLQQNPANSPVMRGFESQIRSAVEGGHVVNVSVTPIYRGGGPIPRAITMLAEGSGGFQMAVSVLNPAG